jgi:hypothetical protein
MEPKVQEASSPAELAQKVREAMITATTRAASLASTEEMQSKEAAVQTEHSTNNATAESSQAPTQPLSEELEKLKKQLEEAKALAESRAQEARAADEKAKKLAVKANQVDKFKALTNDLKEKLAALESSKATPMLSVKGGASASGSPTPATFGVVGAAANGTASTPGGDAVPLVRGRGAPRGTQVARGRGAARGMARGINPRDILSRKFENRSAKCPTDVVAEVESSFRAADTSANTMSVKRPAPGDGATSGDASDEASKRAKLDDKQGGQGGQ